jgi:hypothetical protein
VTCGPAQYPDWQSTALARALRDAKYAGANTGCKTTTETWNAKAGPAVHGWVMRRVTIKENAASYGCGVYGDNLYIFDFIEIFIRIHNFSLRTLRQQSQGGTNAL